MSMGRNVWFIFVSEIQQPFEMNLMKRRLKLAIRMPYAENLLHVSASSKRASKAPGLICRHRDRNSRNFQATLFWVCQKRKKMQRQSLAFLIQQNMFLVRSADLKRGRNEGSFLCSAHGMLSSLPAIRKPCTD